MYDGVKEWKASRSAAILSLRWRVVAIPVAPVEHVLLFKVKYSRQKKWLKNCVENAIFVIH